MDIIERKIQVEIKFFFSEARCPTGAVYYLELCVLRGGGLEPKVNFHSEREVERERSSITSLAPWRFFNRIASIQLM